MTDKAILWEGVPITELSREELYEVIRIQFERELTYFGEQGIVTRRRNDRYGR